MPLDFWGYGSPTFIVASPLAFYITSLFNLISGSLIAAMNTTKLVSLFISATGMFFLVKELYSGKIAFFTACLYILFPGNIFQVYITGSYPSTISLMWFPLILFFTYKYFKNKQLIHLLYAGLCYGGLLLTHAVNCYMYTILLIAFILYISIVRKKITDIMVMPVIILIGILTSAAYFFPLVYEIRSLNYQAFLWNYADLFILPNHTNKFNVGFFWKDYYPQTVSYVVLLCFIILLLLQMIRRQKHRALWNNTRSINIFFAGVAFVSIFLMFGISSFVWEHVPFFKYVQYPSRWLIVTNFAVVVLSASFFGMIENSSLPKRKGFLLILLPFLISLPLTFKYIWPGCSFNEHELIPVQGVNMHGNCLPVGINTTKISANSEADDKVWIIRGKGKAEVLDWKSEEKLIRTSTDEPVTLKIRTFNFPGWTAYVDSMITEIRTEEGSGAILIDIPSGEHRLTICFQDTPIRYYGKLVSLVTVISSLVICLLYSFRSSINRK
jgi:hypothetical protein